MSEAWFTDRRRLAALREMGLLTDTPEVYNLPSNPVAPSKTHGRAWKSMAAAGLAMAVAAFSATGGQG